MPQIIHRAADVLAKRLYETGCRHAFGMPGGEVLTLIDALGKAGIAFVTCKHENSAGFMAEAAHHATGAPALLVATVGPGVVNGVNVIANAEQERVPMIVLTGCVDPAEAQTYVHQVLDHRKVLEPVTKATFMLEAEVADIIADKAVGLATENRPGPVHIDVPISVADAPAPAMPRRQPEAAPVRPAEGPQLELARKVLRATERPVAVIGLDVMNEGCGIGAQAFLERYGIPFVTTYKAKGVVTEDHPLCLGAAGLSPLADKHLLPFVRRADLILCLGYDPIEMRIGWREVWDPADVPVVDIAHAPNSHYMHRSGISFVAAVAPTLEALSDGVEARKTWSGGEIETLKAALGRAFPRDDTWGPAAVVDECRKTLPAETVATVDSGAHRILLSQMWSCPAPRTLLQSSGLCTMGCAVPLAIGASHVRPDRPTVSFSGDAGFLMVAGELGTARELGTRTIFVVFVDASLALIEKKQRQRQMDNAGVDFDRHDFAAIGRAFGGQGFTVTSRAELRTALQSALRADTFSVIGAMIDRQAYDGRI